MYPNFDQHKDGLRFINDLQRSQTRQFVFDCLMRVRCSNGLRVQDHYGNFYMRNATDLEFGGIDDQTALGVLLKNEGKLDEKSDVYIQVALLYTGVDGNRRIRCFNMSLPCVSQMTGVFRNAEMDTTLNLVAKYGKIKVSAHCR
jgi:protein transport protein SEC24